MSLKRIQIAVPFSDKVALLSVVCGSHHEAILLIRRYFLSGAGYGNGIQIEIRLSAARPLPPDQTHLILGEYCTL